jgi:hypothetical protein
LVSALVALTLKFVGDESEPEIAEPDTVDATGLEPAAAVPSVGELAAPDAVPPADVEFTPRPGMAARATRQTSRDLEELVAVAEHHDFTPDEQRRVGDLLRAEQQRIDLLVAGNELSEFALIGRAEDIREDTDNAVSEVLTGPALTAYELMRAPGYESERDYEPE